MGGNTAVKHLMQWTRLGASAMSNQTDQCLLFYMVTVSVIEMWSDLWCFKWLHMFKNLYLLRQ